MDSALWIRSACKASDAKMVTENDEMGIYEFFAAGTNWMLIKKGYDCYSLTKQVRKRGYSVITGPLQSVLKKYLSMI